MDIRQELFNNPDQFINIYGPDVVYEIMKYLDLDSILTICNISPLYNQLCEEPRVQSIIQSLIVERNKQVARQRLIDLLVTSIRLGQDLVVHKQMNGLTYKYEFMSSPEGLKFFYSVYQNNNLMEQETIDITEDQLLNNLNKFIDDDLSLIVSYEQDPYLSFMDVLDSPGIIVKRRTEMVEGNRAITLWAISIDPEYFIDNYGV